jgi:hypothetical protein
MFPLLVAWRQAAVIASSFPVCVHSSFCFWTAAGFDVDELGAPSAGLAGLGGGDGGEVDGTGTGLASSSTSSSRCMSGTDSANGQGVPQVAQ